MNAVNNGPAAPNDADFVRCNFHSYKAARIPYARIHDSNHCVEYGAPHTVDVTAIFPDFDADVDDPASYNFEMTDKYLGTIVAAGTEVFFRLGQSIRVFGKKDDFMPPKDNGKWASICEHIVRHYTEGWANGHKWRITYWEIWNEPDLGVPADGSDGAGGQGGFAGAAVYSFAGLFANTYLVSFENCLFQGNSTATTGTGGQTGACIALANKSGGGCPTARFTRCTFLENVGQPIHNTSSSSSATECVFVGNSMPDGGNRATTYTDCLWESFDASAGCHPASGDEPARTPAVDWYVSPAGSDENSGRNAGHPFKTLTKAFSVLANNATLHVADGVYDAAGGETFPLKLSRLLNLAVVGGDGVPVIDAGKASRALDIFGCHGLSIANLAVTGGKSPTGGHGGGALLQSCRGALSNCAITNNQVVTAWSASNVFGGGLHVRGMSSNIVLDGCLVADNDIGSTGGRQGYGGGLAAEASEALAISNSVIRSNGSTSAYMASGGGIYVGTSVSRFSIFNSLLTGNRAVTGGAAVHAASAGTMENCTVADNLVSAPLSGTLTLRNSICAGNAAEPASTVTLDHTLTTPPGFVGDSYLVASDNAIDAGSVTAASVGLGEPMTVRADGAYDTGVVDLGYHQVSTGPVVAITDLYVSTSGSDSNDGLDAAHPLRSITKALSLVQNGTTVHVSAGTYGAATGETFPLALAKSGLSLVCEDGVAVVDAAGGGDCALAASGAQNFTLRRVVFANARRIGTCGGGLDIRNSSGIIDSCVVTNCMVSIDDASQFTTYGGGLYLLTSSVLLTNCTIVANGTGIIRSNNPRSHGGALCAVSGSSVELAACSIISNFTANANFGVYGAALSSSGASASLTLRNCLITGNRRKDGAAAFSTIAAQSGTLTVENCTIADNLANVGAVGNFGEEGSNKATVSLVNSILADNGAETNGTIAVSHTLIRNGDEDAVNHVVAGDPRFLNPPRGDYRLRGGSPCLNTGLNAGWMKAARDLAGNPRLRNGAVDLGCYESQSDGFFLMLR